MLVLSAVMLLWIGSVSAASDFSPRWPLGSAFHINALDHYSGGGQHNGIDIAAGRGSAVYAVADGVVAQTCNECSHDSNVNDTCGWTWGNFVLIKHTVNGTTYYSRYAHLTQNSLTVSVGQSVSAGQQIAKSGSSGSSSGPHLHLELYQGDRSGEKAMQSFQYYQENTSVVSKLTFSSHVPSSSVYFGSWVKNNYTLKNGVYVYNGGCTTHTKGSFVRSEAAHPHYNYYRCSVCGATFTDGTTTKQTNCDICYPKEYSIYYYVPADSEGNRWTVYKTETGTRGSSHKVPTAWPHIDQAYFSGWSYDINSSGYDLRPGDTFEVCPDTEDDGKLSVYLFARYIPHADVVSGKTVLLYDPSEFTDRAYTLSSVQQTVTRREKHVRLSSWSEWTSDQISASDTVEVETSVLYRYYYFLCNKCGDHNPLSGKCGCGGTSNEWYETWSTLPYNQSNSSVVSYATYKRETSSLGDGAVWYFSSGNLNDIAPGTKDSSGAAEIICNGYRSRTCTVTTTQKQETVKAYKATAVKQDAAITYNANGGKNAPAQQKGTITAISSEVPWRFGYTFQGWSKSASATTADYTPGRKITIQAGEAWTLYAVWRKAEVKNLSAAEDLESCVLTYGSLWLMLKADQTGLWSVSSNAISNPWTEQYSGVDGRLYDSSGKIIKGQTGLAVGQAFDLHVSLTAGQTYYVEAWATDKNVGAVDLSLNVRRVLHQEKRQPTCTESGCQEAWQCPTCKKWYQSMSNESEVATDNASLPALGHNYSNGTCTRCGAADPDFVVSGSRYQISDAGGSPGQTVKVTVSIADNPGIIALRQSIVYDMSVLELTGVKNLGLLAGYTEPSPTVSSPYTLRWADSLATKNNTKNGAIAELTFRIKDTAKEGTYTIRVNHLEARNANGSKLSFANAAAQVTVRDFIAGDLDGDGEVTDWDGILLNRYLAGWTVTLNIAAADTDGDGEVTDWDGILLDRYLAGWQVTLGK